MEFPVLVGCARQTVLAGQRLAFRHADNILADPFRADTTPVHAFVGQANGNHHRAALAAAHGAQQLWAQHPADERLVLPSLVLRGLSARIEEFQQMLVAEGRPDSIARAEAAMVLHQLGPDVAVKATADLHPCTGWRRRPLGIIGMTVPRHTPVLHIPAAVWALAAGNALLINLPPQQPVAAAWLLHEIVVPALREAHAPAGVLSVLCGTDTAAVNAWTQRDTLAGLWLNTTGPAKVVLDTFAALDPKVARLGDFAANDTMIVWRDADIPAAAAAAGQGLWASGTFHGAPRFVLAHQAVADQLLDALVDYAAGQVRPGLPSEPGVLLSTLADPPRFPTHVERALAGGAHLGVGGHLTDRHGNGHPLGVFGQPTVVWTTATDPAAIALWGPPVGPLIVLVVLAEHLNRMWFEEQMWAWLNTNPAGRNVYLHTADYGWAADMAQDMTTGVRVHINDQASAVTRGPLFGGTGIAADPEGGVVFPWLRTTRPLWLEKPNSDTDAG